MRASGWWAACLPVFSDATRYSGASSEAATWWPSMSMGEGEARDDLAVGGPLRGLPRHPVALAERLLLGHGVGLPGDAASVDDASVNDA